MEDFFRISESIILSSKADDIAVAKEIRELFLDFLAVGSKEGANEGLSFSDFVYLVHKVRKDYSEAQ